MSRIGRKPVTIPAGVKANLDGSALHVKGPRGELTHWLAPEMKVTVDESQIVVQAPENQAYRALHGLTRALIQNVVIGVTEGFRRSLEIEGVGYRAELQGKNLVLSLGFSHPVTVEPPTGISFLVDKSQRLFTVEGADRQLVGEVAAKIRAIKPPEPYKGKGVHYVGERIRRKAGKAGKVGTGVKP